MNTTVAQMQTTLDQLKADLREIVSSWPKETLLAKSNQLIERFKASGSIDDDLALVGWWSVLVNVLEARGEA